MKADKNNAAYIAVKKYVEKRAREDDLFAKAYAKEGKNMDECMEYIKGEARKRGTAVMMTDEEVYGMAVHYYDEDKIEIKKTHGKVSALSSEKLSEKEKEKAHKEAIEEYKKCCKEECINNASASLELTEEEKEEARRRAMQAYERQCIEIAKREERERKAKRAAKKNAPEGEIGNLFG